MHMCLFRIPLRLHQVIQICMYVVNSHFISALVYQKHCITGSDTTDDNLSGHICI